MTKLRIMPQAKVDLLEIWHYIAKDNLDAARRMLDMLDEMLVAISEMPGMDHVRRDVKNARYLFHSVGNYVIAYRREGNGIFVVRVVHVARDFRKLFKKKR